MRRAIRGLSAAILVGLGLSGCAIHPLPEDVTHVSTYYIVRQIRCETRQAVIDSLFRYLTDEDNLRQNRIDKNSHDIGLQVKRDYDADRDSIARFNPARLTGFGRSVVGLLYHTGIAYNYDLIGLEINNIDPTAGFIRPLISPIVNLGVTANFDRQRQNERSFTITDNFGDLVRNVREDYCTKHMVESNYIYPIAGKVGIDRVVKDFMLLTLFGNLGGKTKDKDVTIVSGPPTMVDQLQFTTTIGGGATTKLTFTPVGRAFQVSDASFPITASRKDIHQLTVGLYLDKTGAKEIGGVRSAIFRNLITASGGRAEQGAARAVEQFLAQKIFKPTIVVGQ